MAAKLRFHLCRIVVPSALLWTAVPELAFADFADEQFQLRLSLSLERSSNFSDTAGRQASVAFPGGSSDNPAAADWQPRPAASPGVSLTEIQVFSESGGRVAATAGTVNFALRDAGTVSLAYARTYTIAQETRQGLAGDLRSNEFFVTYSRRVSNRLAVGGTLRSTDSRIKEQYFAREVGGLPLEVTVDARVLDGSLGLLAELQPGWFAGATLGLGWASADSTVRNRTTLPGGPFGPIPEGTSLRRFDDDIRSFGFRAGVGYAPNPAYGIYVDAQYLGADSSAGGAAELARLMSGFDLRLTESVVFRVGAGVDSENEVTLSTGLSYRGFSALAVDVAYQRNSQPEIRREFGRFDLLSASLSYRF